MKYLPHEQSTDQLVQYASPQSFYPLAGRMIPWFVALAVIFGAAGLWMGLAVAPTDFQQGEGYRIIFIHVPASWMACSSIWSWPSGRPWAWPTTRGCRA